MEELDLAPGTGENSPVTRSLFGYPEMAAVLSLELLEALDLLSQITLPDLEPGELPRSEQGAAALALCAASALGEKTRVDVAVLIENLLDLQAHEPPVLPQSALT
jgi:hypothetical protein